MRVRVAFFLLTTLISCSSTWAVIAAKVPASKLYTASNPVLITKITAINRNRLDLDVVETLSGKGTEKLRLQIVKPESLLEAIKVGDPIVILVSKGRPSEAVVHMAGKWLVAAGNLTASPPVWQVMNEHSNDFYKTFPGSTDVLIALLREAKSGKYNFLDKAEERVFGEGASEIAQLKTTASGLFGADLNGDDVAELIVATPHGPHIFSKVGEAYQDLSKQYSVPDSGQLLAVGDLNGDGKADLLIDKTNYLLGEGGYKAGAAVDVPGRADLLAAAIANGKVFSLTKRGSFSNGGESKQLWNEGPAPLAAVIGAFDEENKLAAVVLSESGLVRYSLDGRAADFTRLTGEPLSSYLKESGGKFKNPKLVALDANGDGRKDLLVVSEGANFLLINRGFGAYFVSPAAGSLALGGGPDKPFPYASSATAAHWVAVDTRGDHHEDLLILTPDGALYRLGNPPAK